MARLRGKRRSKTANSMTDVLTVNVGFGLGQGSHGVSDIPRVHLSREYSIAPKATESTDRRDRSGQTL